jgi:oxygen-independent coproporphyrinogen III oxidase
MKELISKYNVAGPRYTSYPTVPFWDAEGISNKEWVERLKITESTSRDEGISLYIHLPFCESLCTFCGCHKHITKQHSVETPYIDAVIKEWDLYLKELEITPVIREIHLGGGTPTFFSPENLSYLINSIVSKSTIHDNHEFSFEGHPGNTTREHLQSLFDLGFRRVSYGVQDYSEKVQKTINRIQPFSEVEEAHKNAKEVGYTSISHDLVFGLPHQKEEDILETIRLTNILRPDRISLYSYAHVPWIKGVGQRGFDEKDLPKDAEKRKLYESSKKALLANGYFEVGMDHFALESDTLYKALKNKGLHRNFMGYTTNPTELMIGLGMSSISDSFTAFAQNVKTNKEYLQLIDENKIPVFRGHALNSEDLEIRKHITNLMCNFYTSWDSSFVEKDYFNSIIDKLQPLVQDKLIILSDNDLQVTELGEVFIRNICMCFDLKLHRKKPNTRIFSSTI